MNVLFRQTNTWCPNMTVQTNPFPLSTFSYITHAHWPPSVYSDLQVFKEYFKELEEESVRDNFVTVYELMDEVMDFGFPQTTDSKILQE